VAVLEAMQQYGKVPKLGAVQRWVRDADMAGSEGTTARVLDAILRCTMGPAAASPPAPAAGPLQGSITRHPPWRPAQEAASADAGVEQQREAAAAARAAEPSSADPTGTAAAAEPDNSTAAADDNTPPPPAAEQLRELVFEVPFQPGAGGPDAIHALPPATIRCVVPTA
jgi:pyruvate/2-oxoglutarate dehydrogenase complex dihydrolipoamide acyltransferase (E2) component